MATIIVRPTRTKSAAVVGHSLTYGSAILSIHSVLRRVRLFVEGINNNLQTLNLKHRMRFEPTDEILRYDKSCALKIRATAVLALKELDPLPSSGRVTQEVFEAEVKRITQEKLRPYGCDLFVHRIGGGMASVAIKIQRTEIAYDLIKSFFHQDNGSVLENGGQNYEAGA
jgi:hypothetical protein